jgi:uncharacterized membrane protein (DUF2068 family)
MPLTDSLRHDELFAAWANKNRSEWSKLLVLAAYLPVEIFFILGTQKIADRIGNIFITFGGD